MTIDENDARALAMYRLGFQNALEMSERIAREDRRVEIAKKCGHVPGWQKGRWQIADELKRHLAEILAAANGELPLSG